MSTQQREKLKQKSILFSTTKRKSLKSTIIILPQSLWPLRVYHLFRLRNLAHHQREDTLHEVRVGRKMRWLRPKSSVQRV